MTTERQVDRLLWAVVEARRLRDQEQDRRAAETARSAHRGAVAEAGYFTEWQGAGEVPVLS